MLELEQERPRTILRANKNGIIVSVTERFGWDEEGRKHITDKSSWEVMVSVDDYSYGNEINLSADTRENAEELARRAFEFLESVMPTVLVKETKGA